MPRRSSRASKALASIKIQLNHKEEEDDEGGSTEPMEVDDTSSSDSSSEEEEMPVQRTRRRPNQQQPQPQPQKKESNSTRRSSRSTRFTHSMAEPPSNSVSDLFQDTKLSSTLLYLSSSDDDLPISTLSPKLKNKKKQVHNKSPARRHTRARKHVSHQESEDEEEDFADSVASELDYGSYDDDDDDDNEDMKIQRILASRIETKQRWRELGKKMNTSEVTDGSRWFQQDLDEDEKDVIEERFLVKWTGLSFLHVSWETQEDLIDQVEGAKNYLSTFFRKAENGILLSQDERKDGDYFDPGCVQIHRILETSYDNGRVPTTQREEEASSLKDFDIVLDRNSPDYEEGTGRQILIKWQSHNYSECSYEFERDLILGDIEYKQPLMEYYKRTKKPTKAEMARRRKDADSAMRRSYKLFGDNTDMEESSREEKVQDYQALLAKHVYPNGGQLRDYQAEGVTWFLSNFINNRSCIMADEMGLGKTLQTAAFCHLLVKRMHCPGPFLIVVPLSTISHWEREFVGWTGLNTIVYHGSAEDRNQIRINEFAYTQDRPDAVGANALYLNKCTGSKKVSNPWMATVVITTPEMLVAEDWAELAAVRWQVLVVDEAHRLKNHNSKLATTLRKEQFRFNHKLLLTGTPIQNDVKEFWTLLNFIDPDEFEDMEDFMDQFGDIKSKDRIDELHETIRPYILRRLKEDVEKSVPPKEETLIEVELTVLQKQYYRALYEKNVQFLHKNKRALDGPSLNNLAMQLRKCCNHLFLLNGVEEELRETHTEMDDADWLAKGSGKLVLLDKLLPRLQESGHRVLLFSQFKIMLDLLEDYLTARSMKFERIDGSITGAKRQNAIDRFQDPNSKDPPFIMLLSTRAGGVGINLTSADTCIIFDSDWNPQNDLQAQARCHRIGQTKSVKVYRLLSRKTYEMQMFHMSSMKMGLDQAVLKGFESGASGEGAMTKEEVERLLRHGAYDIFNEDKAGTAETESNDFVQQDIDSILERRSRTVVHKDTGSGSSAAGGTFSKASFIAPKTPGSAKKNSASEDIDIEDPEFWTKMVGEAKSEISSVLKPRKRNQMNYSEKFYEERLHEVLAYSDDSGGDSGDESDESEDEAQGMSVERARWGGKKAEHWRRNQAGDLLKCIEQYGYGVLSWENFLKRLPDSCKNFAKEDICRMSWSIVLIGICEVARDDADAAIKRQVRSEDAKREKDEAGVLAESNRPSAITHQARKDMEEESFQRLWKANARWISKALLDAIDYAKENEPRSMDNNAAAQQVDECSRLFYKSVWPSLNGRGWKEESNDAEKASFTFKEHKFDSPSALLNEIPRIHPELNSMVIPILQQLEETRLRESRRVEDERSKYRQLDPSSIDLEILNDFLQRFAILQLLTDRKALRSLSIGRRFLNWCSWNNAAASLVELAESGDSSSGTDKLVELVVVDSRSTLPHALWTVKHDATLIRAIAKHGWVDRDRSCRDITEDPDIHWGFPFEKAGNDDALETKGLQENEQRNLEKTARRAADFLKNFSELGEAMKGMNRHLIIESYGLKHSGPDGGDLESFEWVVDNEFLHQSLSNNLEPSEVSDLPPRKDLVKRAKTVLQKSIAALETGVNPKQNSSSNMGTEESVTSFGYSVIDQGDRCCILLAEMIRGIVKASSSKMAKQIRSMYSIAHEEALALAQMFLSDDSTREKGDEMRKVADHLATAKECMSFSGAKSKNIARVMLGMEPLAPRTGEPNGSLFPSADDMKKHLSNSKSSKQSSKKESARSSKREDGALGEKAIVRSIKKALDHSAKKDNSPCVFKESRDVDDGLQLTMIEVLILTVLCSEGMPLSSASASVDIADSKITWESIASTLENASRDYYEIAQERLIKCKSILKKLEREDDEDAKSRAMKQVAMAEIDEIVKEEAAQFAAAYASESTKLAKRSIMLLERIRKYGFAKFSCSPKQMTKFENGLGPKVPSSWFAKELTRLATEFDVVNSQGHTRSNITADMVKHNPDLDGATVAAYMDKKSCRQVVSQIAVLLRLRSICVKFSDEEFRSKVLTATNFSQKAEDTWDKRPSWWDETEKHDWLLLKRLNENGFTNFGKDTTGFGPAETEAEEPTHKSMKEIGLTKSIIQQRANQLVRELHSCEEKEETLRMLAERRNRKPSSQLHVYDKSLVDCNKKSSKKKGGTKIQTGLRAFFSSAKPFSKKAKTVVLSDDDNKASTSSKSSMGKRKGGTADEGSPAEKKAKSENRNPGTPPKRTKMHTFVNADGHIQLIEVEE